ncbi:MAG TPA: hypothetical protein VKM54_09225 [Myxococcota bacterium]|nr:hypothetical protein [Myxococcota bacterium]
MIYHVALPADDPQQTAEVLATILDGEAMPFPPIPRAWMAWSGDGVTEIEVVPRGLGFRYADAMPEPDWVATDQDRSATGWHLAIGTTVAAPAVLRIAEEAGWPAQICDRRGFFQLVEVWVDGICRIEVLDPEMQAHYRTAFTQQTWKRTLQEMAPTQESTSPHGSDALR